MIELSESAACRSDACLLWLLRVVFERKPGADGSGFMISLYSMFFLPGSHEIY
jgi:hypothetical protein